MLIGNHTYEEHINIMQHVLQIVKQNILWFNRPKCQWLHNRLAIPADFLTERGLEADPDKVNTIQQFPKPDNRR